MFITEAMIAAVADQYGQPQVRTFQYDVTEEELRRIRSSQKHGRNHDVTAYILKEDQLVVIAKHMYPPGLYRSPSGGVKPGEEIEVGLRREISEETGCQIEIDSFLLRTAVQFRCREDFIDWRSFVFITRYVTGDFEFTDTDEIREVRLADWSEFDSFGRIMRQMNMGGLSYRAALHDTVVELYHGR